MPIHTFYKYDRWQEDREELERAVGLLALDNKVEKMLSGTDHGYGVASFVERVL